MSAYAAENRLRRWFTGEEHTNMKLTIPSNAEKILQVLNENGHEAYVVGGCVRDSILDRNPNDWDITTSASPYQVKELFPRTIDTGLQHGTVTVMMDKEGYEVTTYRVDGEYEDGRHPKQVTFTSSLEEDLKRRDFTINAMAYHPKEGLVDLFHGMDDMRNKIIRCVGDPLERFHEDALRIMRAVRFSAQLGFEIEAETKAGISRLTPNLRNVSAERIQAELVKLLVSPHPDYLRVAYETGITREFLPEFDLCMETEQNTPYHCFTVGEHILHSLLYVEADKVLRLTMLLHDIAKPVMKTTDENGRDHFKMHAVKGEEMSKQILRRLKFDNDTINHVCLFVRYHDDRPALSATSVRRMMSRIGEENMEGLLAVKRADTLGQSMYQRREKLAYIDEFEKLYQQIIREQQCVKKSDLALNGRDLIRMGMQPGKQIGAVLDHLFELVLEHPECNTRECLEKEAHILMTHLI